MSDIVDRLRAPAYWISGSSEGHEGDNDAPMEAAAEIESLRFQLNGVIKMRNEAEEESKRLRAALRFYANWPQGPAGNIAPLLFDAGHTARAALTPTEKETEA